MQRFIIKTFHRPRHASVPEPTQSHSEEGTLCILVSTPRLQGVPSSAAGDFIMCLPRPPIDIQYGPKTRHHYVSGDFIMRLLQSPIDIQLDNKKCANKACLKRTKPHANTHTEACTYYDHFHTILIILR